jgi:hypothetical protein
MVKQRSLFWLYADCELPGLRITALLESARIAFASGDFSRAHNALSDYFTIRPDADKSLPETMTAKTLLANLRGRSH